MYDTPTIYKITNQTTKEDAKRLDASLSDKLLNCFKSPDLAEQLEALKNLEESN